MDGEWVPQFGRFFRIRASVWGVWSRCTQRLFRKKRISSWCREFVVPKEVAIPYTIYHQPHPQTQPNSIDTN
jgi:hypothetical protein